MLRQFDNDVRNFSSGTGSSKLEGQLWKTMSKNCKTCQVCYIRRSLWKRRTLNENNQIYRKRGTGLFTMTIHPVTQHYRTSEFLATNILVSLLPPFCSPYLAPADFRTFTQDQSTAQKFTILTLLSSSKTNHRRSSTQLRKTIILNNGWYITQ